MTAARIPAETIVELAAAIETALAFADKSTEPGSAKAWTELIRARSIVTVYLVRKMQPVDVEITESEAA